MALRRAVVAAGPVLPGLTNPDEQWRMQYVQQAGWNSTQGTTGPANSPLLDQFLAACHKTTGTPRGAGVHRGQPASHVPLAEWIASRRFNVTPPSHAVRDARWRWALVRSWVLRSDFITGYIPGPRRTEGSPPRKVGSTQPKQRRIRASGSSLGPDPSLREPLGPEASLRQQYAHLVEFRDALRRAYIESESRVPPASSPVPEATYRPPSATSSSGFGALAAIRQRAQEEVLAAQTDGLLRVLDEDGMRVAARREIELLTELIDTLNAQHHVPVPQRLWLNADEKRARRMWYGQRLRDGTYTVEFYRSHPSSSSLTASQPPHVTGTPSANTYVPQESEALRRDRDAPWSPSSGDVGILRALPRLVRQRLEPNRSSGDRPTSSAGRSGHTRRETSATASRGAANLNAEAVRRAKPVVATSVVVVSEPLHPVADFSFDDLTHAAEILVMRPRKAAVRPIVSQRLQRPSSELPARGTAPTEQAVHAAAKSISRGVHDFGASKNAVADATISSGKSQDTPRESRHPPRSAVVSSDVKKGGTAMSVTDRLVRLLTDPRRGPLVAPDGSALLPVVPCEALLMNNNRITNTRVFYGYSADWSRRADPASTVISSFEGFSDVLQLRFGPASLETITLLDLSENLLTAVPRELSCLSRLASLRLHGNRIPDLSSLEALASRAAAATLTSLTIYGNPLVARFGVVQYQAHVRRLLPKLTRIDGRPILYDDM